MKCNLVFRVFIFVIGLALFSSSAMGQGESKWTTLKVHAAKEVDNSYDVRIYPDHSKRTPGNAAPVFMRLWAEMPALYWDNISFARSAKRLEKPLEEYRQDDLTIPLRFEELKRAANCTHADWNRGIYNNPNLADILLPDVQQGKAIIYALAVNVRSEIARGHVDNAIEQLETGFGICRHLQNTPFFVVKLVGKMEMEFLTAQVEEIIQHPDCPNLYWALQRLPSPMLDMTGLVDFEAEVPVQNNQQSKEEFDESCRFFMLPPALAIPKLRALEQEQLVSGDDFSPNSPTNLKLYVSLNSIDRRIAMLKTVEAIRAYVAEHGKLPESLDDIVKTPAVPDPFTGKPFDYKAKNKVAFLLTEKIDGVDQEEAGLHYRIMVSEDQEEDEN